MKNKLVRNAIAIILAMGLVFSISDSVVYAKEGKKVTVLKIYTNSFTKNFKGLGKSVSKIKTGKDDYFKIRFVPAVKNLTVKLESVEYIEKTNKFKAEKTIFTVKPVIGKAYEFKATIPEGIPCQRLTAIYKGKKVSWILGYDGRGDRDIVNLRIK